MELCVEFTVFFYARAWFEAPLAAMAARSDLAFISHVLRYYSLSVVFPLLQACYRQLWYLTGELVVFALVDDGLPVEEREALAKAIHGTSREGNRTLGKPVFPTITTMLLPNPTPPSLSTLVTTDSWSLFDRLGLLGPNVSFEFVPHFQFNLFVRTGCSLLRNCGICSLSSGLLRTLSNTCPSRMILQRGSVL